MMLTFGLFVGVSVVVVTLYATFILPGEITSSVRGDLHSRVILVADLIDSAPDSESRVRLAGLIAEIQSVHVTLGSGDSIICDVGQPEQAGLRSVFAPPFEYLSPGELAFRSGYDSQGGERHYVSLRPAASGLTVRIGQSRPPLLALVYRMRGTLIVAMIIALMLSLVGSWVAAQKVTVPLKEIRDGARRIADGQPHHQIRIDSRAAEFQEVETSLNRMSDSFREQIDRLERMTTVQNEFIGNVSHEVRNPIFAVGGYLEALASPGLTDAKRALYAEKALTNLQRLSNLFNDLIEIARLEFREDILRASVFDLSELVAEVAEMISPKASLKSIGLEFRNRRIHVLADRNRIRQVVINLIENAVAYSDEGTVRCRIARRRDKVRLEVVDAGRGIDEQHLERIFDRFYRVDPDRSRKSGGTGLGLSIVKQILQAHGESIHVESTMGRGSRFWFELPYATAPEAVPA
jgi:signal transduction histidine kinase